MPGMDKGFPKAVYGIGTRDVLYPGELEYFKKNPKTTGMAADDDMVILNPYSTLTDQEKKAVMMNEAARVHMRKGNIEPPRYDLTPEQKEQIKKSIVEKSLKQQFNPEFLNRIDDIVLFNTLNKEDIKKIIEIELKKLENRLSVKNYKISFDESVLNEIEKLNTMEEYGARPVKRIIQNLCEDFLSDEILKGNIKENQVINLKFEDEHMKIF